MNKLGPATEAKINEIVEACKSHGHRSIIALAGVPGTGKSFIASIATQRFAQEPLLVREIQFHQSFSYEEFVEGLRIDQGGEVSVHPGVFLEWNDRALEDPEKRYVLLIEELTRANIASVLGEVLTFIEHRDRPFLTLYSRRPVKIAKNLTIVATFNPTDKTAIEIDSALLRRLRIIQCPPSVDQLGEMLNGRGVSNDVIQELKDIFVTCEREFGTDYLHLMPFGHGIFSEIQNESPDLKSLWNERIEHFLRRPLLEPHPFTGTIEKAYRWK